jgi:Na+-translocating ferredoxin:NAD+ oxidoreductase RnfC subunit
MTLLDKIKSAGVVGAGGAGFPTHVKLKAQVEWFLANGSECEPLMHKDRELMLHFADEIVNGMRIAAKQVGAKKAAIGVKKKNKTAIHELKKACTDTNIKLSFFEDYYPAGDEYEIVHTITGRLIPPQGLPLDVGCVVNNVETLYNISKAVNGEVVTDTFMTITGLVKSPLTTWVPVGMSVADVLQLAGGTTTDTYAVMESGLMMGSLVKDLKQPVTKTTGGLIVLPADHNLIQRYSKTPRQMARIGHSACDQCTFCTELCPRYLLGYDVQPHLVMRSLGFSAMGSELWNKYSQLCCQCGLCTLYACPEALYPREACVQGMTDLRDIGQPKWDGPREVKVHPTKNARRVPIKQLMTRLGVSRYESEAEYVKLDIAPKAVRLPLKQHVGAPAKPVVKTGEFVRRGQLVAEISADELGANIHSSIDGRVVDISDNFLDIEA